MYAGMSVHMCMTVFMCICGHARECGCCLLQVNSKAVAGGRLETLQIRSLDVPLVCAGVLTPLPNPDRAPDMDEGMTFNMHNNIWGTNYAMWWPYTQPVANIKFRYGGGVLPTPPTVIRPGLGACNRCDRCL